MKCKPYFEVIANMLFHLAMQKCSEYRVIFIKNCFSIRPKLLILQQFTQPYWPMFSRQPEKQKRFLIKAIPPPPLQKKLDGEKLSLDIDAGGKMSNKSKPQFGTKNAE